MSTPSLHRPRVESIDLLRGIVMILMALDHVRDFFGAQGASPTDLSSTTVALFFTRWITNICAPVFFLLAGSGAYLSLRRKSKPELSRFLFTRGLWLLFLEVVVLRCLAMQFNFDYRVTMLVVIWALGWAMIVLSALIYLPMPVITAFGIVMIAAHNLLDFIPVASFGCFVPLWNVLHVPGLLWSAHGHVVFVAYPLIPWVGVMAAGYGLGRVVDWSPARRKNFLLWLGIGLTAAFIVLRAINLYGDPSRWSAQKSGIFTVLSFLNTTKYTPSLLFLLMTLGPSLILLSILDGRPRRFLRPVLVFGRVPFFYYALHLVLIHLLAVVMCFIRYGQVHWMFESPNLGHYPITRPPGWGLSLPATYLVWAFIVVALYPLCKWFAELKQSRREAWLSYL